MKIINITLNSLALLSAYFQLNDPDPWLWVGMYIHVALVCGLAFFNKGAKWFTGIGLVGSFIGLGILMPDFIDWWNEGAESIVQSMKAEKPHIELTREFLGLLLCFSILAFQWWYSPYQKETFA